MNGRTRQHMAGHRRNTLWIAFMVHSLSGLVLACFLPLHLLALGLAIRGESALDDLLNVEFSDLARSPRSTDQATFDPELFTPPAYVEFPYSQSVDAEEVGQTMPHLVHRVVRLVTMERPIARIVCDELDIARRADGHVRRVLGDPR